VKLESPRPAAGRRILLEINRVEDFVKGPTVKGMPAAGRIEIRIVQQIHGIRRSFRGVGIIWRWVRGARAGG